MSGNGNLCWYTDTFKFVFIINRLYLIYLRYQLFGRLFVKQFALCYRTVVLSCLSVTFVHCGQTVGWIKMKLGVQVGLCPGHIVLDGDPPPPPRLPASNWFRNLSPVQLLTRLNPVTSLDPVLRSLHWLKINERIEYKLLSLNYKVLTTNQPPYLHHLISVQPPVFYGNWASLGLI